MWDKFPFLMSIRVLEIVQNEHFDESLNLCADIFPTTLRSFEINLLNIIKY